MRRNLSSPSPTPLPFFFSPFFLIKIFYLGVDEWDGIEKMELYSQWSKLVQLKETEVVAREFLIICYEEKYHDSIKDWIS